MHSYSLGDLEFTDPQIISNLLGVTAQGSISRTNLSLASHHFVLDLSPKPDLIMFVSIPVISLENFNLTSIYIVLYNLCTSTFRGAYGQLGYYTAT